MRPRQGTIPPAPSGPLCLEPIGYARTAWTRKVDAPRQPQAASGIPGCIELLPGRHFEHALEDLEGWSRIWVIYWFHLNASWRPKVLPPRSRSGRKGVFSTRAPHRPNPLGLSVLRLQRIEGLTLHLLDFDLVDGTPVLDIKPYVPYTDAHPDARSGWLEDPAQRDPRHASAPRDPIESFVVEFDAAVLERCAWISAHTALPIERRIRATLSTGPAPHPYRRIRRAGGGFVLAVEEWRASFEVEGRNVSVLRLVSGFRSSELDTVRSGEDPLLAVHREFRTRFGAGS
jgi:tRNA-Thr(GGU) m(6)t(6)A37 methyltransferase TsaA